VVGESMSGKGSAVNTGDLPGQEAARRPAGVRATIVAMKPGNAGGAKGGRKADASEQAPCEEPSPGVPEMDKQGEEDLWQRYGAEREVWTLKMLEALENGVKGAERSETDATIGAPEGRAGRAAGASQRCGSALWTKSIGSEPSR
jgi:hypothetical protein